MADSDLDEALRANGYAKVIVSIRKDAGLAAASAPAAESSIEGHFMIPSEAQAESLALAAERTASRHVARVAQAKRRRVRVYPHLGLAIGYADTRGIASLRSDPQ